MFEKNLHWESAELFYQIFGYDPELERLYKKYDGKVHVKISAPESAGTESQNRLMHGLMTAFFLSGMHSSPAKGIDEFKLWLKSTIGVCFDYKIGDRIFRVAKSWSLYSKTERSEFIDSLISMIIQAGADSDKKINGILTELEELKKSGTA